MAKPLEIDNWLTEGFILLKRNDIYRRCLETVIFIVNIYKTFYISVRKQLMMRSTLPQKPSTRRRRWVFVRFGGVQGDLVQGDGGQAGHEAVPTFSQDPQDDLQLL